MSRTSARVHAAALVLVAAALSGCAAQPETIVADDDALCAYSATGADAKSYTQCRNRLQNTRMRMSAGGASRIEGYALLQAPVQPTDMAGRCTTAEGAKDCAPGDVTGTIRSNPKR
jgi:hypothetical protein